MTLHRIEVPAHVSPTGSPTVGFIDSKGNVVVEPRLFQANNFWEGRAAVNPPSKGWGIIDEAGLVRGIIVGDPLQRRLGEVDPPVHQIALGKRQALRDLGLFVAGRLGGA